MNLPEQFLENMKILLGEEYAAWLASYDETPFQGLRINTMKMEPPVWESRISPFALLPVTWTENGYYYKEDVRPAKHPYYYAGLYYLQEPSAMAPAALLPVEPGDRVLDLCAAPGGKSTELGAKLKGQGILVSNDISNSRARSLLKNLELFGIPNICVTSEEPEKLADTFGTFFDKILVDAPCSGEGMFRKDPDLVKSWMKHGPEYYAPIQRKILKQAVRMLKPGGLILYSTCTFAEMEDEDTIGWLLKEAPEMELAPLTPWEGACGGVDGEPVLRLFPHKIHGEGHFAALLQKKSKDNRKSAAASDRSGAAVSSAKIPKEVKISKDIRNLEKESDFLEWEQMIIEPFNRSRMMVKDHLVYYLPEEFERSWNLRYLRTGLLLGEWKKQRFEPSQAAAMALRREDFAQVFSMNSQDERVIRYLKGETIFLEGEETLKKGWTLVCVDGYPLGWAKYTGSILKNKYYPGWRWQ